jgi:hypothetical protein
VIAPPVQLDVTLSNLRQARVLVLLSCSPADGDSLCEQREGFLAAYLAGLGITHRITTTEADFRAALRSGFYNTYWESGGRLKIANSLGAEVREAVFRGDALIRDGVHDERNHELDDAIGARPRGKLSAEDQLVRLTGTLFAPGTLPGIGRALKLDLESAVAQGVFPDSQSRPAIVSNEYGLGRSVLFAYDLVATAMAHPSAPLDDAVLAGLGWLAPVPASPAGARSYTVVRGHIANVGITAELKATLTPPAGATVLSTAPAATPDASGRPVWTFTLESGVTQDLDAGLRLPEANGSTTASLAIDSIRNGIAVPYNSFDVTLSVETADFVATRVLAELAALGSLSPSDRNDRDSALASIQAAQSALLAGDHEAAIAQFLTATGRLLKITSANVLPQRVDTARLLQEAQIRWAMTQP